jgi:hypothetical protein
MPDHLTSNQVFSPKRYFLDAPKEQPGTCFVKNDDYAELWQAYQRLQHELAAAAIRERNLSRAALARAASPPTGGLSCSGCREWIAANAPGGWIDDLRKRAVDMQNSLDTQEKIHCDFVAAYSAHEPADSRGVGLAETDWNRALSGNFHALDPQHQPVFDKLARLAEPPADRLQFFFDWMTTPNPNFGNAVPLSMLEAGLGHKVAQFIRHAIEDEAAVTKSAVETEAVHPAEEEPLRSALYAAVARLSEPQKAQLDKLRDDQIIYGTSYARMDADGTITRLAPNTVMVDQQPESEAEQRLRRK